MFVDKEQRTRYAPSATITARVTGPRLAFLLNVHFNPTIGPESITSRVSNFVEYKQRVQTDMGVIEHALVGVRARMPADDHPTSEAFQCAVQSLKGYGFLPANVFTPLVHLRTEHWSAPSSAVGKPLAPPRSREMAALEIEALLRQRGEGVGGHVATAFRLFAYNVHRLCLQKDMDYVQVVLPMMRTDALGALYQLAAFPPYAPCESDEVGPALAKLLNIFFHGASYMHPPATPPKQLHVGYRPWRLDYSRPGLTNVEYVRGPEPPFVSARDMRSVFDCYQSVGTFFTVTSMPL
jgi:hypothetical protein